MRIPLHTACAALLLFATGCFRVGSDTRALRDAALDNGLSGAREKIEVGVGMFTLGVTKVASRWVEMPEDARRAVSSLKGAEVSVYELDAPSGTPEMFAKILTAADASMAARQCTRLAGVIQDGQLVAIYVPRNMRSEHNVSTSVMVINNRQLVCVSARADLRDLLDLALNKIEQDNPEFSRHLSLARTEPRPD